jgi:hypothetical protein
VPRLRQTSAISYTGNPELSRQLIKDARGRMSED